MPTNNYARVGIGLYGFILLCLLGCATPSENFLQYADELRFRQEIITGSPFQHRIFVNQLAYNTEILKEVHIYLDGDGTPWLSSNRRADDPTARKPLILELMTKDPAASILLGRPCYYGLNNSPPCNDEFWTSQRYSESIVGSMASAIETWAKTKKIETMILIGYSGGGALAALLASRLTKVTAIVTVAANLDVEAWNRHHGYRSLPASLNPAADARIPPRVRQIHLAGLQDRNVPPEIIEAFSLSQTNSLYVPMPNFDHVCCWPENWSQILKSQLGE